MLVSVSVVVAVVLFVAMLFAPLFACIRFGVDPNSGTAVLAFLWLIVGCITSPLTVSLFARFVLRRLSSFVFLGVVVACVFGGACVASARPAFVDAEWGVVAHSAGIAAGAQVSAFRSLGVRAALAGRPGVAVFDVDECVLDNVPVEAGLCLRYSVPVWDAWCVRGSAASLPGSVPAVRALRAAGWRVVFVTGRSRGSAPVWAATWANLVACGFEFDELHCVGSSRRKPAFFRAALASGLPVVFVGDQRTDAPAPGAVWAGFGWSFVSLPNWMY